MHALFGRAGRLAAVLAIAVMAVAPVSAFAGRPVVDRVINNHFTHSQHFDPDPACGPYTPYGVTEIATGNEHLVIVEAEDHLHISYNETFRILAVPDDPTVPTDTRQGTGALSFNLLKDGTMEVFHESFHDFGHAAWDPNAKIHLSVTFVYRDGEVIVDHAFVRDGPPPGC